MRISRFAIAVLLVTTPAWADDPAPPAPPKIEVDPKVYEEWRSLKLDNDEKMRALAAAKRSEITGSFPSNDTTGKTEVKGSAGLAEAQGLNAATLNGLAKKIATGMSKAVRYSQTLPPDPSIVGDCPLASLKDAPEDPRVVGPNGVAPPPPPIPVLVLDGTQSLSFAHYELFRSRACMIASNFNLASGPKLAANGETAAGSLAGLGTGLTIATKLAKLLQADWEVGSIALSPSDRSLIMAVSNAWIDDERIRTAPLYLQGVTTRRNAGGRVLTALERLDSLNNDAVAVTRKLNIEIKATTAKLKTRGANRAALNAQLDALNHRLELNRATATAYAALIEALAGKPGESAMALADVIDEAAAAELLGQRGIAVSMAVENAAGGYYTRRALWDVFDLSGPPFFVSSGSVVSYVAVRPADRKVFAAGLFACNSGFTRINKVTAKINGAEAAKCDTVSKR